MTQGKEPEIGLVIRHLYLWHDEARKGQEEGRKARPCVIVHTRRNEYGKTQVFIAPITHTQPRDPGRAKEIPQETKKRLGLDHEKSWIILDELNFFTWMGPDLMPTPGGDFTYGDLPTRFTKVIVEQMRGLHREKQVRITNRDEKPKKKT